MSIERCSPRLCIGLPTYNAESFIAETIESILSQTYADYLLVISDDGSTDGTDEIIQRYAKMDGRIRYHKNPMNLGPIANFNLVHSLAPPSTYFCFKAHDDVWSPSFLEKLISALDTDENAVLAFARCRVIDATGRRLYDVDYPVRPLPSRLESIRILRMLRKCWTTTIYGMFRRSAAPAGVLLDDTCGVFPELFFLSWLFARGKSVIHPEYLYLRRLHSCNLDVFPDKCLNVRKAVHNLALGIPGGLASWEKVLLLVYFTKAGYHLSAGNLAYFALHPWRIRKSTTFRKLRKSRGLP